MVELADPDRGLRVQPDADGHDTLEVSGEHPGPEHREAEYLDLPWKGTSARVLVCLSRPQRDQQETLARQLDDLARRVGDHVLDEPDAVAGILDSDIEHDPVEAAPRV